jgi:hypothetical protein
MIGVVYSYTDLQSLLRLRAEQLGISRELIDQISGLPAGYAGKILSANPTKRLGPDTIGPMLGTLCVKLVMVEDECALAKYGRRMVPRDNIQARNAAHAYPARMDRIRHEIQRALAVLGGNARSAKLSPEHRKRIARIAARARWKKRRLLRAAAGR